MRRMSISLLQAIAEEQLPVTIEGAECVDSVQILAMAGHVVADVAEPVRTPMGWVSQSAVVKEITRTGRRTLRTLAPMSRAGLKASDRRPCGPRAIGIVVGWLVAAGMGLELVGRLLP